MPSIPVKSLKFGDEIRLLEGKYVVNITATMEGVMSTPWHGRYTFNATTMEEAELELQELRKHEKP